MTITNSSSPLVSTVGVLGDVAEDVAGRASGQPAAAAVEQQRGGCSGAGPVWPFVQPELHVGAQLRVERHLADLVARAVHPQAAPFLLGRRAAFPFSALLTPADRQSFVPI